MRVTRRFVRAVGRGLLPRGEAQRLAALRPVDAGHGYDVFGMHRDWVIAGRALLHPVYRYYFRVSSYGAEHIPSRGAAILVANHAGTLPIDAVLLCMDVLQRTTPPRATRCIVDRFLPKLPFVGVTLSRMGAVSGTKGNVTRLLEAGELCLVFPEGLPAIGKPLRERYALRELRRGFAELAMRQRVPVVPVAVIGSEEQWPQLGRLPTFGAFGLPYLPIVATPLPLPVHYRLHYGPPLDLGAYAVDGEVTSEAVERATRATRTALEQLLARGLSERTGVFR